MRIKIIIATAIFSALFLSRSALAFEGRIDALLTRGNQSDGLLYTAGTGLVRVEMTATNLPNPVNIFDLNSGGLTLLFPGNRSFVRIQPAAENSSAPAAFPQMPGGVPPGAGPPSAPAPNTMPNMPPPGMGMPALPRFMMEQISFQDTGQKTNLLGFACEQYEIKRRGETMEIWAADQLFPFQAYVENQPHRFGPRIEEQWSGILKAKKLFPLLAVLKSQNGVERLRFEVQSVTPEKITSQEETKLFQPPPDYQEIQPLPF